MKYEIKAAYQGGQLTLKQRTGSLFDPEPRVLGTVLRRGSSLILTDEQLTEHEGELKRLYDEEVITVTPLDRDDRMLEQEARKAIQESGEPAGYEVQKAQEEAARAAAAKAAEDQAAAEQKAKLEAEALAKAQEVVAHDPVVPLNVTPEPVQEAAPAAVEPVPAPIPEPAPVAPAKAAPAPKRGKGSKP